MLATATYGKSIAQSGNATHKHQILFLTGRDDLLSECIVEVLSNRLPDFEIIVQSQNMNALDSSVLDDTALIITYEVKPELIAELSFKIRKNKKSPAVGVVVGSVDCLDANLNGLVARRVIDGILPMNLRLDVFLAAIELLIKGGEHFPSALLREISPARNGKAFSEQAPRFHNSEIPKLEVDLTTREIEILDLLCSGTQNKIIADLLSLSENTVKVHIRNIYKKMNVRNRTEAASLFFRGGGSNN